MKCEICVKAFWALSDRFLQTKVSDKDFTESRAELRVGSSGSDTRKRLLGLAFACKQGGWVEGRGPLPVRASVCVWVGGAGCGLGWFLGWFGFWGLFCGWLWIFFLEVRVTTRDDHVGPPRGCFLASGLIRAEFVGLGY